ncbi:hypothetical protein EV122DRAFT_227397, partial [Schizophyllum commune]
MRSSGPALERFKSSWTPRSWRYVNAHHSAPAHTDHAQERNASLSLKNAQKRIEQYKRVLDYSGTHLVPGLHRIFANALKQHWSAKKLFTYLVKAMNGEYHARNYSQMDIDLAVILYTFGGASAVYAFSHSYLALPSLNTIQPHRRLYRLRASTDGVKVVDLVHNIDVVYGPQESTKGETLAREAFQELCGLTLAYDETMIERKVEWIPDNDNIGGTCLEHSGSLESVRFGNDLKNVGAAAKAVRDGTVHVASEVTVGTISHLSRTGYGARPVFLGPTCKKRSYKQSVELFLYTLEAWNRSDNGAKKYGEIWNLASDGDAIRRAAMFTL